MNTALLVALFVVTLLLLVRMSERALSAVLAVTGAVLVLFLAAVNLGATQGDLLARLARTQGLLVVVVTLLGGAAFTLGAPQLPRLRTGGLRLLERARPVRVQRTAKPVAATPRAPTHLTVSDLHFQEYEVLDRVGVGGMGSVYRARRKNDGKVVALKVPQEKYLADAKFVKRFYREAEVLKRFSHPNIVRVYDYRMQDPEHYIAMEFLDGQSLEALLEERELGFGESVQILRALADALRHIHMQNVVHRDIKPANVMVTQGALSGGQLRDGGVKLMDFGIAVGKVLTRLTMTGARVGTPIYMAPEQAKGNRVDARSDVYSLGLLAYEMVTGQTAFRGSYEAVVHQQVFESPKPPKQVRLDVPGKFSDLVLDMIEKDPAGRPTLDEVIARIDAGVLSDETFDDPVALAISIQERHGTLRLLDLHGKLRLSLRDQSSGEAGLPGAPGAIVGDRQGHLYIALVDLRQGKGGPLIRKLDAQGREVLAFGSYGLAEGELLRPVGLAMIGPELYVLDAESCAVSVFTAQGKFVRRFGGRGSGMGRFAQPAAIAASPAGEIYVLDHGSCEVQRFSAQGEYLSRYAFRLDRGSEGLRLLEGLSVDAAGNVYIVDSVARKLRRVGADGSSGTAFALETLVGEPADATWLLQVSEQGQIYAVRQGGQVLRTYSPAGDLLTSRDMYAPVMAMALLERPRVGSHA